MFHVGWVYVCGFRDDSIGVPVMLATPQKCTCVLHVIHCNLCFCTYLTEVECSVSCVLGGLSFCISLCLHSVSLRWQFPRGWATTCRTSHTWWDLRDFRMAAMWLFSCNNLDCKGNTNHLRLKNSSTIVKRKMSSTECKGKKPAYNCLYTKSVTIGASWVTCLVCTEIWE